MTIRTEIRTEMHKVPWGEEWYALIDAIYDGDQPLAGVGSTEEEAITDLLVRMEDEGLFCSQCGSGPGEPHSVHCDPDRRS